jgi:hypothetical protein
VSDQAYVKRLRSVYETIKDHLNLVVIDLDKDDDAQEIFETLNALGTPLLPADLVKNFLFHRAEAEQFNTQKLYDMYWKQFEDEKSFWRREIGQGRFKRPRLDWFLQYYLTLIMGEEAVTTQLFSSFRDHVEENHRPTSDYLEEFKHYGGIYKGFEDYPIDTWQGRFFYRLNGLETTTIFPLLLEVFNTARWNQDEQQIQQICLDLESFLVRRVVCQLTPKNYNKFFSDIIEKLRHQNDFSAYALRQMLLQQTVDTSRWPDDQEFGQAWRTTPFFKRLSRSRVRLILEALDSAMHTGKSEKIIINERLTIEHLMPQDWALHWPLNDGETADRRNLLVHTVGNLTLLTKKLNPAVSNASWDKKRPEVLKHSALALNRQFQEVLDWNEDQINKRTAGLFDLALRIWPYPSDKKAPKEILSQSVEVDPQHDSPQVISKGSTESINAEPSADDVENVTRLLGGIPDNSLQLQICRLLCGAGVEGLTNIELVTRLNCTPKQLSDALGALGTRVKASELANKKDKPTYVEILMEAKRFSQSVWHFIAKPILIEAMNLDSIRQPVIVEETEESLR